MSQKTSKIPISVASIYIIPVVVVDCPPLLETYFFLCFCDTQRFLFWCSLCVSLAIPRGKRLTSKVLLCYILCILNKFNPICSRFLYMTVSAALSLNIISYILWYFLFYYCTIYQIVKPVRSIKMSKRLLLA